MPIDISSLKKMESLPAALQTKPLADRVVLLIKMKEGFEVPDYVNIRMRISAHIITAELAASELSRLDAEEGVATYSLNKSQPQV